MVNDVVLNIFEREIVFPDGGEVFDPVRDGELFDGDLFGHEMPPKKKYSARKEVKEERKQTTPSEAKANK